MAILKPLWAVFALCLLAGSLKAQETVRFGFDMGLSIKQPSSFGFTKVVDNRVDTTGIGYINAAFGKKRMLVTDYGSLSRAYAEYANSRMPESYRGKDTLLIVINDFKLEEVKGLGICTFYFKGCFFLGGSNQFYLVRDIDAIYEGRISMSSLAGGVRETMFAYLDSMAATDTDAAKVRKPYTEQQASNIWKLRKARYPIYRDEHFRTGVYYTFDEFLNNAPADSAFIQKDHYIDNENRPKFFARKPDGKKGEPIGKFFAIYNGSFWYQPNRNGCVRLKYVNGDFYRYQYFLGVRGRGDDDLSFLFGLGATGGIAVAVAAMTVEEAMADADFPISRGAALYEARLDPLQHKFYPVRRIE